MEAFKAGAETLSDLYTSDAKSYSPGGETISGDTAIGAFWKGTYGMGIQGAKLDAVEAEPTGDQIVEMDACTLYGDGDGQLDMGKYLVVRKQESGNWKLHRDSWNTRKSA